MTESTAENSATVDSRAASAADSAPDSVENAGNMSADMQQRVDQALRTSRWNSGAAEAHGLLSALACRGVAAAQLGGKAWLLRLSGAADLDMLDGMYGLILRDLRADGFAFNLWLPVAGDGGAVDSPASNSSDSSDSSVGDPSDISSAGDSPELASLGLRLEALTDWCGGFVHGFLHDGAGRLDDVSAPVREAVGDIIDISRLDNAPGNPADGEQTARQLLEIEEYLRVATQLIYEEMRGAEESPVGENSCENSNDITVPKNN